MRIGCQVGVWKGGDVESIIPAMGKVAGVQGVETFAAQLKPYHEELGRLKALLEAAGLRLSGAYFNSNDFVNPEAEDSVVGDAAADCDFLREVGGFLVANGGPGKGDPAKTFSDEDFAQLAKVLNRIGAGAAERGVRAVMHPHLKCMIETPADVDRLAASGLDQALVGLCVHASHQLLIGADPYGIYETHAAWVRYAHVGNATGEGKSTFLGEGVLDQERLMRPLLDAGFDGWIIIECGKEGVAPAEYARNAIDYLKSTWPKINWED